MQGTTDKTEFVRKAIADGMIKSAKSLLDRRTRSRCENAIRKITSEEDVGKYSEVLKKYEKGIVHDVHVAWCSMRDWFFSPLLWDSETYRVCEKYICIPINKNALNGEFRLIYNIISCTTCQIIKRNKIFVLKTKK